MDNTAPVGGKAKHRPAGAEKRSYGKTKESKKITWWKNILIEKGVSNDPNSRS